MDGLRKENAINTKYIIHPPGQYPLTELSTLKLDPLEIADDDVQRKLLVSAAVEEYKRVKRNAGLVNF